MTKMRFWAAFLAVLVALAGLPATVQASAVYPTGVRAFTTKLTGEVIQAAHVNDLQDEVVAIEQALLTVGFAHNLIPSTTNARDFGTSTLAWRDAWFTRTIQVFPSTVSSSGTLKLRVTDGAAAELRTWSILPGSDGALYIQDATAAANRWKWSTAGHFLAELDNTYDVGALGANRPRSVYVGTNVSIGASPFASGDIRLPAAGGDIKTAGNLNLIAGSNTLLVLTGADGHPGGDNIYDWGTASFRWRNVHFGTSIQGGGTPVAVTGAIRLAFNASLLWRNSLNTLDLGFVFNDNSVLPTPNTLALGADANKFTDGYFGTSVRIGTTPLGSGLLRIPAGSALLSFGEIAAPAITALSLAQTNTVGNPASLYWSVAPAPASASTATYYGPIYADTLVTATGSANVVGAGLVGSLFNTGMNHTSGTLGNAVGVQSNTGSFAAGGTITSAVAFEALGQTTGTITNWYGLNVIVPTAATNQFGIRFTATPNQGTIHVAGTNSFTVWTNGALRWSISSVGTLFPDGNNTQDVGGTGNRMRDGYFGTSVRVGAATVAATGAVRIANNTSVAWRNAGDTADIVINVPASNHIQVNADFEPNADNTFDSGLSTLRWRDVYAGTSVRIGTNPAASGALRLANDGRIIGRNAGNTADIIAILINTSDQVQLSSVGGGDIRWGIPLVALGGGATATLGTIGGSGPATAAQNTWMRVVDSGGATFWVPAWK